MQQRWTTLNEVVSPVIESSTQLKEVGNQVKTALHDAVLKSGDGVRSAADVLHGVALGHPLHPILTDVTIGAWGFAAVFDVLSLVMPFRRHHKEAADTLTALGIITAIPTATAGITDFSTIKEDAAAYGLLHGLFNVGGLVLYILSYRARKRHERLSGIGLSLLGLSVLTASSWLGGEMVYRLRVGVNHSPEPSELDDWKSVLPSNDLAERQPQRVDVNDQAVLLYRDGDNISAISAVCAHAGGPLEEGKFYDGCVQCPWHDSVYELRSGAVVHGPSTYSQPAYDVRVSRGQIQIRAKQP